MASGVAVTTMTVPAQPGFLAIYNPSLGATDETLYDQIVYYSSVAAITTAVKAGPGSRARAASSCVTHEERNERLRQIGLAQGMVEFGRSFSGHQPVGTIETEKSRVVLHEVEPGWWILASIHLTRDTGAASYSSREVKPAALLLEDLLRAHAIFLLHHASSLSALFVRSRRDKFAGMLGRYWDLFLATWNPALHGNPVRDVLGAIQLAAGGELGVGVGEEERGSGEREVLEGMVDRMDGLVDLVVGKYGGRGSGPPGDGAGDGGEAWLGTGREPGTEDGAIFLGTGALSRKSLRDITYWMEDLYTWGEDAYGVQTSPLATRKKQRTKRAGRGSQGANTVPQLPGGPPPAAEAPATQAQPDDDGSEGWAQASGAVDDASSSSSGAPDQPRGIMSQGGGMGKVLGYLKLGYGTSWTWGTSSSSGPGRRTRSATPVRENDMASRPPAKSVQDAPRTDAGIFLIGLKGHVDDGRDADKVRNAGLSPDQEANSRTMLRTLTVELESERADRAEWQMTADLGSQDTELSGQRGGGSDWQTNISVATSFNSQDRNKTKKLRVVVYAIKPFIFTFLFLLHTDSLAWDGLYRSLHHQLAPLRKSLLSSTAYRPERPDAGAGAGPMFDLVWDPEALTVRSTIPAIPAAATTATSRATATTTTTTTTTPSWVPGPRPLWTRAEALSTHTQLLNLYAATRTGCVDLERTTKTSRGWWIVWTRLLERGGRARAGEGGSDGEAPPEGGGEADYAVGKEVFLLRRAGECSGAGADASGGGEAGGDGADSTGRLAQGIGLDTKKYIESLVKQA
ncbi:hypothetical protein P8C59_008521 [Phyllachora maydis]|uniref:CCZ1/INTU/HSP4 first Longin domain-containing protein n=1 Tax=Phyllachora maydis TaxID=1825666 RepID=A0AAD9IBK1_9PEZI|nr:hypothetical protein P8C59_008521 [Phyllachora maydis]